MLDWTLLGEFYSIFILLILLVRCYYFESGVSSVGRPKLFIWCLGLSIGLIVLNIGTVYMWEYPGFVPRWLNILLNSLYFELCIGLCSLFAYMLFYAMLEHVYDRHCMRRAVIMLSIIMGISLVLVVSNYFTGCLFYVDEQGVYSRGPLNRSFYLLMVAELVFLVICYIRNRASVGDRMFYVMRCLPPLVVLLTVLQVSYPDILLNGTICSSVSLVLYIAFRSHTADVDSITGVGSRRAFMQELSLRTDSGQSIQMIQVALLNLSDVNLRWGHAVGDAVLYEVARYCSICDGAARVFRTGSATFTIMLPLGTETAAEHCLLQLQERFQQDWVLGDVNCRMRVAIADLRSESLTGTPSEIVECLEFTMQQAKSESGLARFDGNVSEKLTHRTQTLELMRRSIDQGRFYVDYQPIYCCHHDLFCSAEALLRLRDDNGKPVSPAVFIPLAEEYGMIGELTWIVLDNVCRILSSGDFPKLDYISVNFSMQQLLDQNLAEHIRFYLEKYNVEASRLRVEITERFILHDAKYAAKQLESLTKLGLQIYMDDFGTGYSNLSSVLHYPFSFVKLDRSLIMPVAENEQAAIMVRALLQLFHDLDKRVIAEGVEEEAQVKFLREIGIDMIQGYYFARPVSEDLLSSYFK